MGLQICVYNVYHVPLLSNYQAIQVPAEDTIHFIHFSQSGQYTHLFPLKVSRPQIFIPRWGMNELRTVKSEAISLSKNTVPFWYNVHDYEKGIGWFKIKGGVISGAKWNTISVHASTLLVFLIIPFDETSKLILSKIVLSIRYILEQ